MSQHEAVMTKHDATSGLLPFDTTPVEGYEIKREGGVKPFAGFLYIFNGHGPFTQRLGFAGVVPNSGLAVTITEIDRNDASGNPFIGNAGMSIGNVAPGNGFVDVHGSVDYGTNLNYRITVSIV
jgi:hypothetical protein